MQEKLESARKELLDLGLRNPLLNYKTPTNRGLTIVQEKSAFVFEHLVINGKAMSFLGRPSKEGDTLFDETPESQLSEAYVDNKLQTNETDIILQTRLLNTFYDARTNIEERGVNILYISLGMLEWFESDSSQEIRRAPLILIPVFLERSSAKERFRVKHSLEDIEMNISLQAKMKAEFNLQVPCKYPFSQTASFRGFSLLNTCILTSSGV